MPLSWGRRYLMCPPTHFGVAYEINPWMHAEVSVDRDVAQQQWDGLVTALRGAGAQVEVLPPVDGLPDLVFTANAGLVSRTTFVPSAFRHPERQGESAHDAAWFAERGYDVRWLPDGVGHEGAGDALPFGPALVSGYRFRSDAASHGWLGDTLGVPVRSVELVDERLYHLDLTFCPLDDRRAIVAPMGWDAYGAKVMAALIPEPLVLESDESLKFVANSVVIDDRIVMPVCPPRVGRVLERWGYVPMEADVSEFLKAGGGCRCLTLALDVELPVSGRTSS